MKGCGILSASAHSVQASELSCIHQLSTCIQRKAQDPSDSDTPLSDGRSHVRQAWTVPTDDAVAAYVVKDIKDMHKAFQTFLRFLFAETLAAQSLFTET